MKKNNQKAFTLIEILVVIAIIGILTSLLLANFAQVRSRARDNQRKSDLNQIKKAFQMYLDDNYAYPTQAADNGFVFGGSFTSSSTSAPYMQSVPQDPLYPDEDYQYTYAHSTDTDTYLLKANLENDSDKSSTPSYNRCDLTPTPGYYVICPD